MSQNDLEPRLRYWLAAGAAGLYGVHPELWFLSVLGLLQLIPVLFVPWRLNAAHSHLPTWIRYGFASPTYRALLRLAYLERYLIKHGKAPTLELSPLQPLVTALVLQQPWESTLPIPALEEKNVEKTWAVGYQMWLETRDTLDTPLGVSLLSQNPSEIQSTAKTLHTPERFWIARAWFMQGQHNRDTKLMEMGAQTMHSSLETGLLFYAWRRQEWNRLLAPYGQTLEIPGSPAAAKNSSIPWVTIVLLLSMIAMLGWEYQAGGMTDSGTLVRLGANVTELTLNGEPWRVLTSAFLHGGLLHIGFNGFYLFQFGTILERRIGGGGLLLTFVLAAVVGSLFSIYFGGPSRLSVGASGAIFGMVALQYVMGEGTLEQRFARLLLAAPNLGLMLALGFLLPNVDVWAHFGGLLTGVVLGLAYQRPRANDQWIFGGVALAALAWAFWNLVRSLGV